MSTELYSWIYLHLCPWQLLLFIGFPNSYICIAAGSSSPNDVSAVIKTDDINNEEVKVKDTHATLITALICAFVLSVVCAILIYLLFYRWKWDSSPEIDIDNLDDDDDELP